MLFIGFFYFVFLCWDSTCSFPMHLNHRWLFCFILDSYQYVGESSIINVCCIWSLIIMDFNRNLKACMYENHTLPPTIDLQVSLLCWNLLIFLSFANNDKNEPISTKPFKSILFVIVFNSIAKITRSNYIYCVGGCKNMTSLL